MKNIANELICQQWQIVQYLIICVGLSNLPSFELVKYTVIVERQRCSPECREKERERERR